MVVRGLRRTAAAACAALFVVSACSAGAVQDVVAPKDPVTLKANVTQKSTGVHVDTIVTTSALHGTVTQGDLETADGKTTIKGRIAGNAWVASQRLEPGTAYRLRVTGHGEDGKDATLTRAFSTEGLTLQQQTYPSVAPLQGETVGVGMPVIVTFDLPVKNRALFERNMSVRANPAVEGSWNWFSDREVHFRPEHFWKAGTKVKVVLRLNGLPAAEGIYGQQDQDIDFTIGRKAISTVDTARHRLTYTVDGKKIRTVPVSTGDAQHRSREGTKIIMEKFSSVNMDAATTGIDSEDPGYYNIKDVRWAMRVTNSGEFLHAAPWTNASQGHANVSHGCTGMSTASAAWIYHQSRRGDVVKFVHSPRALEDRNGWTDWNVPWGTWTAGSALSSPV